jgi:SAM-dependent methyltransferase
MGEEVGITPLGEPQSSSAMKETSMAIPVSMSENPELADTFRGEQSSDDTSRSTAACPLCGKTGAKKWLSAPDWMHGRPQNYTLVRCSGCSIVWLNHPPRPEEMHLHYTDAYHKLISEAGETSPRRWAKHTQLLSQYKQSGAVLDLGCSSGAFLASLPRESWELYGIEMSEDVAKRAEAATGAKVFVGDILEAPFPPGSFDMITCFDVLEHLYEPRTVMAKIREWLKPGGVFYVFVPNIDSAEARVFGTYWCGLELPRHLFHYSPASLRYLAESSGLEVASITTTRNPAVGYGLRYFFDDRLRSLGVSRTPRAYLQEASLPWKAARKLVRMTALRFLLALAPLAGEGEAIHGFFRKGTSEKAL